MTKTANSGKSSKPVKMAKVDAATFLGLCAKDKTAYKSNYKRVPMEAGSAIVAKYTMVAGVPHKMVNGVLTPLAKKA
jgi:hypothetical protein